MELFFLLLLVVLMMGALMTGYPVGLALPGAAIVTIGLAGASGWLIEGNPNAFFAQGGPGQWLSAGVTNLRSLYWDVDRDTLIAIPLFIFMGIMLQRSRVAEDLLVAMAQLFGSLPGGLGISVVLVGALLAATTGIVGATVIAMGLISLPAMQRNNYSVSLATGTICASGTLGQIIPPSIVLIILADQLANAADVASTTRKAMYKDATGEFSMPAELDVVSASAGDMFMGALIPGLILVGIYVIYILVHALMKPESAPPVRYDGKYDLAFAVRISLALVPPLTLILTVLGSIIAGIATVNQAGAIGAVGSAIMAGYRLSSGRPRAFLPAILAIVSVVTILLITSRYDVNIRDFGADSAEGSFGVVVALIGSAGLLISVTWSLIRTYRIDNTLRDVMAETTKTTSMVFVILLGAAMLTSAFRAFGGEELIRHFLTGLPGGFWMQFVVVMLVIFLLGFFLDFIEIAVVVVPIVAPILLANPDANITAVWLGVMIGLNIQTSYLTPPFGFALFYLRGVAPAVIKTIQIYKGAAVFVILQIVGLAIAGFYPPLVNFLPNLITLTSEVSPPPVNPRLQSCLENHIFKIYSEDGESIRATLEEATQWDLSRLPVGEAGRLRTAFSLSSRALDLARASQSAHATRNEYAGQYRPMHRALRDLEAEIKSRESKLVELRRILARSATLESSEEIMISTEHHIASLSAELENLKQSVPSRWLEAQKHYTQLTDTHKKAQRTYRQTVDEAYQILVDLRASISADAALGDAAHDLENLVGLLVDLSSDSAKTQLKEIERRLSEFLGTGKIRSHLSKARRALREDAPNWDQAVVQAMAGKDLLFEEHAWRQQAAIDILPQLTRLIETLKPTIGARLQPRLSSAQAWSISRCKSSHQNVGLNF